MSGCLLIRILDNVRNEIFIWELVTWKSITDVFLKIVTNVLLLTYIYLSIFSFQGQPKAEWTARLGTVRIQTTSPWQQERRIVGMVRSPVEGSMLALVRLEEPVEMTDFVRPICLPNSTTSGTLGVCNTLSWARHLDQLQRVHVTQTPMQRCENVSIATVNGLCAEALYDQDDCDVS